MVKNKFGVIFISLLFYLSFCSLFAPKIESCFKYNSIYKDLLKGMTTELISCVISAMKGLKETTKIDLSGKKLDYADLDKILYVIYTQRVSDRVEELDLSSNKLMDVPEGIKKFTKLKILNLRNNLVVFSLDCAPFLSEIESIFF